MLMLAAVVAIAAAQTLGIQQGYICDCGGMERWTSVDHCHGPHTAECHEHELDDHACDMPLKDHGAQEDTHTHEKHVASLVAKPQHFPVVQVFSPVPQVLPVNEWLLTVLSGEDSEQKTAWNTDSRGSDPPPWAERLTHCIALRV